MKLSSLTDMEADVFELLSVSGAFEGVTLTIMNTQTWEQSDVIKPSELSVSQNVKLFL